MERQPQVDNDTTTTSHCSSRRPRLGGKLMLQLASFFSQTEAIGERESERARDRDEKVAGSTCAPIFRRSLAAGLFLSLMFVVVLFSVLRSVSLWLSARCAVSSSSPPTPPSRPTDTSTAKLRGAGTAAVSAASLQTPSCLVGEQLTQLSSSRVARLYLSLSLSLSLLLVPFAFVDSVGSSTLARDGLSNFRWTTSLPATGTPVVVVLCCHNYHCYSNHRCNCSRQKRQGHQLARSLAGDSCRLLLID